MIQLHSDTHLAVVVINHTEQHKKQPTDQFHLPKPTNASLLRRSFSSWSCSNSDA